MHASSAILVSLAGLGVAGVGVLGVVAPTLLTGLLGRWRVVIGLPMTFALRMGFGLIFLVAAPDCRAPVLVRLVGLLEFVAAALLLILGAGRLERFGDWWLQQSPSFVRYWCLGALTLGVILIGSGEPGGLSLGR